MQATLEMNRIWRIALCLGIAISILSVCSISHAQVLQGSAGAGWQTWTVTPNSSFQPDLNDNGAPYWDVQWGSSIGGYANSSPADRNA